MGERWTGLLDGRELDRAAGWKRGGQKEGAGQEIAGWESAGQCCCTEERAVQE